MQQEAERLRAHGLPVEEIDLADGSSAVDAMLDALALDPTVTLFIDGLDIALLDGNAAAEFQRALGKVQAAAGVTVRVALRTGFAPGNLIKRFRSLYGADFAELTIAPLTTVDIHLAADHEGVDPDKFLSAVKAIQLGPLAGQPPTLKMLFKLWDAHGRLPPERGAIYHQGCEELLKEMNTTRRAARGGGDPVLSGRLTPVERLAVASRLAAIMTFGDYKVIDDSLDPGFGVLPVEKACGGAEPVALGEVKVDLQAVREVIRTGLFRAEGGERLAFCHPSLMQFLAARFLVERDVKPDRGLPLLVLPNGRVGRSRIDVASWAGVLSPDYRKVLLVADPQVLLRVGVPLPTGPERMALAEALLKEAEDDILDLEEFKDNRDFVLVVNDALEARLGEVIGDNAKSLRVREFACRLARDCAVAPTAALGTVARDGRAPMALRGMAMAALRESPEAAKAELLSIIAAPYSSDDDFEIRTLALMFAARIGSVTPADVILQLAPRYAFMSAQGVLIVELLQRLRPAELPASLDALGQVAIRTYPPRSQLADVLVLAKGLCVRAFAHLDNPAVLEAMARLINVMPQHDPWLTWTFSLWKVGMARTATPLHRRALLDAVVSHANSPAAARALLDMRGLLRREDFSWVIQRARSAQGQLIAQIWSTIAVQMDLGLSDTPHDCFTAEGLAQSDIDRLTRSATAMPGDFEAWTPPPEGHEDDEDDIEAKPSERLTDALFDWRRYQLRAEGGGRENVVAVTPETLLTLAAEAERRLVTGDQDLLRVVRESLDRLGHRLKGRDALVRALWNEDANWGKPNPPDNGARPKDENFLSDIIVDHLRRDLEGRGVVADREVQVRTRISETKGSRTDIQIQAFTRARSSTRRQAIASVTIEVKGCWNREVLTAMETQLRDRYMALTKDQVGMYLVGWYVCPAWANSNVATQKPTKQGRKGLLKRLRSQAARLSVGGLGLEAYVLDVSLN
jgi:hypothetical protein